MMAPIRWNLFRRDFELDSEPRAARLDITVDGRYQLFVNGTFIGRGPVRSSADFQRVDRHDIGVHLKIGRNVVAVLVHVYGVDTAWYERSRSYWQGVLGDGGVYVACAVEMAKDSLTVNSDTSWRCLECDAWRQDTPRSGWGQDFIEDFDAARFPGGWTDVGFDASSWANAREMILPASDEDRAKGWAAVEPFPVLVPREIPMLVEARIEPCAVDGIYAVEPRGDLSIDRQIFEECLETPPGGMVLNSDALLCDDETCTVMRTSDTHDAGMLIRFERIHSGYPFIELEGASGGEVVEVAVAKTVPGEFGAELEQPVRVSRRSFLDCAHVFRYLARPGDQRFEKFEWTGVRYLQLTVRNAPQGLRIRHVGSRSVHYPLQHQGVFECSDAILTELWDVGRYTAEQCTHDGREDCPGREKRQWLGDGLVHYLISAAAFGTSARAMDLHYLKQGAESQRPDGLLQMFAPGDHHVDGVVIPDFNLHWILTVYHYYQHYGDVEAVGELFPTIQKVLAWFQNQTVGEALVADVPYWHFIEWSNLEREGISLAFNALLIGAVRATSVLAGGLGYQRAADGYSAWAERAAHALNDSHWDAGRGAYVDSIDTSSRAAGRQISQQGNALMIHFGIAPRERWQAIVARITDADRLKLTSVPPVVMTGEEIDVEHDVVQANTFFSHYVFCALADAGRFDLAIAQMRAFYEPMLAAGATTLWESHHPGASLCHAFSATAVYQLSANALGVRPGKAGFEEIVIAPQPGDLEWARGVYPTVFGPVGVSWRLEGVEFVLDVDVPNATRARVVVPPGCDADPESTVLAAGSHQLRFRTRS